ncbi:glycosyltransferase family 4 protein [Bacteroides sp. ET71]|uniref:glycosyltransferase family 4 protein n=1 Tax=Bacteroides sp. ET71 TaxID=2939421 RepID=UPI002013A823|nr:glycosyltransferase family 4 protein [Bacteroides sp. ET71]MCL1617179.1 glycosyltransferase family 4 protein [Bacteroides sp. ET71]
MRIAYIVPSLQNQGPIVVVRNLVSFLVEWGHDVDVFYFDNLSSMNFKCPTKCIKMGEKIDFNSYDIIHSHCMRPDMYVAKWRRYITKARIISTLHQDTYRTFCYQYNPLFSYLFTRYWCHIQSKFDGVISISKQLENTYKSRIKSSLTTIYNGCSIAFDDNADKDIICSIQKLKAKYKILGTYSYVTRRKGLNQVVHALKMLKDYAFIIIGEGPDIEPLKQMVQDLEVSERVLFFPYQKNPCNYLPYFDVYVMPSYSEGFGLAMVEGALAHKSIVCSDIPSFHEIFSNDEVRFFELDNICSLKEAILLAFENREENGKLAYLRAKENFTVEKMVHNYLCYYDVMLNGQVDK